MANNQKADGSVIIDTQMDTTDIDKSMDGLGKHTDKAEKKMQKLGDTVKKVGKAIVAAFAVQKVIQFAKETVKVAEVQEEMERKLETIMRQRMGATEDQIQSVKDLTAAQQALGVVGDEVQMSGAQQLATFLRTSDALKTLIPAMNNLAVQQNGVNVSASAMQNIGNLMGKVMQGQTSALTRVGISFSKAEEKILKYGTEQQKAATLAQVITNNVGNMNEALANTPAGKIQQIKNNFGDMLETLGMGIQNIMTPFLGIVNKIVQALQKAATAFRQLTEMITGVDANASPAISGTGEAADLTDALAEAEEKEAEAKKKQTKEQKRYLSGLDEIRRWESDKEDEEEEEEEAPVPSTAPAVAKETTSAMDGLLDKLKELADLFKAGFWDGLGDYVPRLKELKKDLATIKAALKDIWTDPAVLASMDNYARKAAYALGQIVGAAASIGLTIANLIVGGIADFLVQSKDRIKQHLIAMFDIGAEIWEMAGEFAKAIAYIFEAFGGENAQAILGTVLSILFEVGSVVTETVAKLIRDIGNLITQPIIQNADSIRAAFENTLAAIRPVFEGLLIGVRKVGDTFRSVYDNHIKKFIDDVIAGITTIVGNLTEGYNQSVAPVLLKLSTRFKEIMNGPFGEFIDAVGAAIGTIVDTLDELWNDVLMDLFDWISTNIMPLLGTLVDIIGTTLLDAFEWLLEKLTDFATWISENQGVVEAFTVAIGAFFAAWAVSSLVTKIATIIGKFKEFVTFMGWFVQTAGGWGGILNILKTAFSGLGGAVKAVVTALGGPLTIAIAAAIAAGVLLYKHWDEVCKFMKDNFGVDLPKVMETLKTAFQGLWDKAKAVAGFIAGGFKTAWEGIQTVLQTFYDSVIVKLAEFIKGEFTKAWEGIRNYFVNELSPRLSDLKTAFDNLLKKLEPIATFVTETLQKAFEGLSDFFNGDGKGAIELFQTTFDGMWSALKPIATWVSDTLCGAFSGIGTALNGVIDFLKGAFTGDWQAAWNGLVEIIQGVFQGIEGVIKTPLNAVIGLVNSLISGVESALNWVISGMNSISIDIPDWVPFAGGNHFGISIPPIQWGRVPELAKGAVIPPNAPFMAMLGDQRQGTNIEAPLDTIKQAMRDVMGSKGNQYTVNAQVGARTILQIVIDEAKLMQMQTGKNPFETI